MRYLICLVAVVVLGGCASGEIGQSQIDKAYPKMSQEKLEAELAKAGKLEEYKAGQARDAAVSSQQGGGQ